MLRIRMHTQMRLGNVQNVREILRLKTALQEGQVTPLEVFAEGLDAITRDLIRLIKEIGKEC